MYNTKALFKSLNIGLVFSPYPLSDKGRVTINEYITPDETIQEYLERIDIVVPEYMQHGLRANGIRIPFELWDKTRIKEKAFITIVPNAGEPTTIAIVFGAIAAITSALSVATVLLVNKKPIVDTITQRQGTQIQVSPTYSITGGSNQVRPYQPMPLVFGKHLMFPDLAITSYTRIEGANQILYQIFNLGINELTVAEKKIEQTALENFNEVITELSSFSTGKISLFPATTLVTAGSELEPQASEFVIRTSAENATALIVDLELQMTRNDPETGAFMVVAMTLIVQMREIGTSTWVVLADSRQYGVVVNSAGATTFTNRGPKIARRWLYRTVPQGQYEVRVRRVPQLLDSSSFANLKATWVQLLSMQPDEADYSKRMRLGLRIRATAQISGTVDRLSVIVANLIPVWNGSAEVIQQSSNPGHLYIWFLRGDFNSDGSQRFGAGLSDDEIDLDGLREWAVWCDDNDLTFNAIIDTPQTIYETLQQIAAAGRASPQLALTKMSVVFDEESRLPIQAFGMASIIKDSFKVTYATDNLPTEVIVKYIDEDRNYEKNEVRQSVINLQDEVLPSNPVEIELFGVTNLSQAGREANLIAASFVFRRRVIEFTVDIENLIATRGDVILIGHDLTSWSDSGRLTSGTVSQLTLDKSVTVGSGSFITIRDPDINLTTHTVTSPFDNPTRIINISPSLSVAPDDNTTNEPKDYVWLFEDDSKPGLTAKILDIKTQDDLFATLTCVEDTPEYYLAENDDYVFVDPFEFNGELASVRKILFSETLLSLNGATQVNISWSATQTESVDVTVALNDGDLETFSGIKTNSLDITTTGGDIVNVIIQANAIVELRASHLTAQASYQVLGLTALPEDVESFSVTRNGDNLSFEWTIVNDIDLKYYEIRKGGSWKASYLVAQVNANVLLDIDYTAGTFLIKAVDLGLRESKTAATTSIGISNEVNIIFTQLQESLVTPWAGTLNDLVIDQLNQLTLASNPNVVWGNIINTWESITDTWDEVNVFVNSGTYITNSIDIGAVNVFARVDVVLTTSLVIPGYTWLVLHHPWIEYGEVTWAGEGNPADFTLFISSSNDDTVFTDFEVLISGGYNARYYKFKLVISKEETSSDIPTVQSMKITLDVQDIIVLFNAETIPAEGRTFTFEEMNIVPNTQATIVEGETGDVFVISNETTSSVFIQLFRTPASLPVAGVVNLNIHGY